MWSVPLLFRIKAPVFSEDRILNVSLALTLLKIPYPRGIKMIVLRNMERNVDSSTSFRGVKATELSLRRRELFEKLISCVVMML